MQIVDVAVWSGCWHCWWWSKMWMHTVAEAGWLMSQFIQSLVNWWRVLRWSQSASASQSRVNAYGLGWCRYLLPGDAGVCCLVKLELVYRCCCLVVKEHLLREDGAGLQILFHGDAGTSAAVDAGACCLMMLELVCSCLELVLLVCCKCSWLLHCCLWYLPRSVVRRPEVIIKRLSEVSL